MLSARLNAAAVILAGSLFTLACGSGDDGPPVATPSITLPQKAVSGQSISVTYRFAVAADAPPFAEDYVVFVHAYDESEGRVWTSDHEPPTPTGQWKAGSVVEYTQPMSIPRRAAGKITIQMGLYSPRTGDRVTLSGADSGKRAYSTGSFTVAANTADPDVVLGDGFYPLEAPEDAQGVEWQWSEGRSVFWLKNDKRGGEVILDLDQPMKGLGQPQKVTISAGGKVLGDFVVSGRREAYRVPLSAVDMGTRATTALTLSVDRSFVPSKIAPESKDARELGVRVFGISFQPAEAAN